MKILLYILFLPIILPIQIILGILQLFGFAGFTKDIWEWMD